MRYFFFFGLLNFSLIASAVAENPIPGALAAQKWLEAEWKWQQNYVAVHVALKKMQINFDDATENAYIFYLHGCLDGAARKSEQFGEVSQQELIKAKRFEEATQKKLFEGTIYSALETCSEDFQNRILSRTQ